MNKRVGVLFSGGLDSTYIVWDNLKKGNIVVPFYVEIINNENKTILEKNRINILHKLFYEEFGDKIKPIVYAGSYELNYVSTNLAFYQVPIWLMSSLFYQSGMDVLQIGYIAHDDAVAYAPDIINIYNSYNEINDGDLVPLEFPILKMHKERLAQELPTKYQQNVVSCENPINLNENKDGIVEYIPCGHCAACKKILNSDNFGFGLSRNYRQAKMKDAYYTLKNFSGVHLDRNEKDKTVSLIIKDDEFVTDIIGGAVMEEEKCVQLEFDFDSDEKYDMKKELSKIQENLKS